MEVTETYTGKTIIEIQAPSSLAPNSYHETQMPSGKAGLSRTNCSNSDVYEHLLPWFYF